MPPRDWMIFDIETAPGNWKPFVDTSPIEIPKELTEEPKAPSNWKDPVKIAAKIAEKKALLQSPEDYRMQELNKRRDKVLTESTLDSASGRVCAIGWTTSDHGGELILDVFEPELERQALTMFWRTAQQIEDSRGVLVGHNILGFDIPFIVRRSYILGVCVPSWVHFKPGMLSDVVFRDTKLWWWVNRYDRPQYWKLERIAKGFGLPGKPGDGARFHLMLPDEQQDYLAYDVAVTHEIARKFHIIEAPQLPYFKTIATNQTKAQRQAPAEVPSSS